MPARHKLNTAAVNGILFVAGLVALIVESWTVFFGLAALLAVMAIYSGDIRLNSRR